MKTYIYKLYDENGVYIRTLPEDEVISPFEYAQQTGDSFVELPIKLARNADQWLEGSDIDFNNIIKVYCIDKEQPNGAIVFQGKIINYVTNFDHPQSIEIMCQSFGQDMDDFLIVEDEVADISQLTGAGDTNLNYERPIAQSFVAVAGSISSVDLKLKTTGSTTVEIVLCPNNGSNQPDMNNPLGSGSLLITNTSYASTRVPLTASVNLSAGTTYWIVVRNATAGTIVEVIPTAQANHFSNGTAVTSRDGSSFLSSGATGGAVGWGNNGGGNYYYEYNWMKFAMSTLPANGMISSVTLRMIDNGTGVPRSSVISIEALTRAWTVPMTNAQFVAGASLGGLTQLATYSLATSPSVKTCDFTSTSTNLRSALETAKSGGSTVDILLGTDKQRLNSTPAGVEDVTFYSMSSAGNEPRLRVTTSQETITAQYNTTAGTYTSGKLMIRESDGTWSDLTGDLYFQTNTTTGATKPTYTSQDPATIVNTIMTNYQGRGGAVQHTLGTTVILAGALVTYTFNSNTMLEGLKKLVELAGSNYYFFVDVATNLLYFKGKSGSYTHRFTIGKDVTSLKIEKRTEDIVNVIYFTGGEVSAGVNFYKKYTNAVSIAKYGQKAISYSDNRVTVTATANTIAQTILNAKGEPEIRLTIEVADSNYYANGYDLETINVGDMIAFRNFGTFTSLWDKLMWDVDYWDYSLRNIETLVLQVVRLERKPDKVVLGVSTSVSDAVNRRIEEINRTLKDTIQQNNPTTPS